MSGNRERDITFRPYDHKRDARAALEVFREVGWLDSGGDRRKEAAALAYFKSSRSWVAQRASALAFTGALAGPAELIRSLDSAFSLPPPHTDWDF